MPFNELSELFRSKVSEFAHTDLVQVHFSQTAWALGIGLFIVSMLALKLLFSRNRNARAHSGHPLPPAFREGALVKALRMLPKCIVAAGALFCLLALAKPFLPKAEKLEFFESRERIDLLDVSVSMGWEYQHTNRSEAQVAREGYLKFLDLRRGKRDRASLWVFSNGTYKVDDFIVDDDVYKMEVDDAPYVVSDPHNPALPQNSLYPGTPFYGFSKSAIIIVPKEKVRLIKGESGTDLKNALRAVMRYFDLEGAKKIKKRSLLIITDAEANDYPREEIRDLGKKHITPYVIWIDNTAGNESYYLTARQLIRDIVSIGGKYYRANDPGSMYRAFEDVDRSEKNKVRVVRYLTTPSVYQKFLFMGCILICVGCLLGLFIEIFWGEYPS